MQLAPTPSPLPPNGHKFNGHLPFLSLCLSSLCMDCLAHGRVEEEPRDFVVTTSSKHGTLCISVLCVFYLQVWSSEMDEDALDTKHLPYVDGVYYWLLTY
jgi:hypothetical protein